MGVQSLGMRTVDDGRKPGGQIVDKEATLGRSGMTGLAGEGDHLHFTMLVNGRWWTPRVVGCTWIQDRILRKLRAVGGTAPTQP